MWASLTTPSSSTTLLGAVRHSPGPPGLPVTSESCAGLEVVQRSLTTRHAAMQGCVLFHNQPSPPPPAPLHPASFHCPFHSHCALLGVPLLLMCIIDPALQKNDVCRFVHTSCLLFTCYRSHMYADILSSHTAVYPWQQHACITALLPAWHAA